MESQSIGIVTTPTLDLSPYLLAIADFIGMNYPLFLSTLRSIFGIIIGISIVLCVFFFVAIIITVEKLKAIRIKESEIYDAKVDMGYNNASIPTQKSNPEIAKKWDKVLEHVESENPNDWRQAVMESDIILEDVLTQLGYMGDGVGGKLKRANKADFKTLDDAWEAHKVRNQIAHAGSDYPFSQFDARKVIQQYKKVFEEFFYI